MLNKIWEKVAYNSLIRVILVLAVAFCVAIKFPEGQKVLCAMATALEVKVEACGNN